MAADTARIDDLRRRVQQDPASIAFAHLAEEHRRAGDYHEAVLVCRAGLEHHPVYLLAHVTLGRALMELEQYPEARTEFEYVLRVAPDNLIALKGMEALQQKEGPAPHVGTVALAPLKLHPSIESAGPGRNAPLDAFPPEAPGASPPQTQVAPPQTPVAPSPQADVAPAPNPLAVFPPAAEVASALEAQVASAPEPADPAMDELQRWLAAIEAARGERT